MTRSFLTHLECGACGTTYPADRLWNLCPACAKPLLARYDLEGAAASMTAAVLAQREAPLWCYREVVPVVDDAAIISLGEGWTPLNQAGCLVVHIGCPAAYNKDE